MQVDTQTTASPGRNPRRKRSPDYQFTPEMDARIRQVYRTMTGNGEVNALAAAMRIPRWKVSQRARDIGAYEPRIKEPNWSEREMSILERSAHRHPEVIRRHLKKAGFKRSITGIILKRKRLRLPRNLEGESANGLAMCLGIDNHAVLRWIEKGYLKAVKRGTDRTERQGGDTWWIKNVWIQRFLVECIGLVDIRKVDKFWLVEILSAKLRNSSCGAS